VASGNAQSSNKTSNKIVGTDVKSVLTTSSSPKLQVRDCSEGKSDHELNNIVT
jgi:hypothetical protein